MIMEEDEVSLEEIRAYCLRRDMDIHDPYQPEIDQENE